MIIKAASAFRIYEF